MTCPEPAALDAFACGRLTAEGRVGLEAHLDACPSCSATAAELVRIYGSSADRSTIGRSTPPPVGSLPPAAFSGSSVGRYQLGERLGEGGMGVVFVAHDPELDRRVAVKLLHPDPSGDIESQRARLMREAQAMAKLSHPNVVTVHDVGRVGDQLFLAMELVEGTTLTQWLAAKLRGRDEIVAVFVEAGRGLARAHEVGLTHRDFKPDNVLIGRDGRARVTDFGLAHPGSEAPLDGVTVTGALAMTATGALVGTPAYMAPEQLRGEPADARSDQFSFGVALFEALFGARPFAGENLRELAHNVLVGRMRPVPPGAPRWLRKLLVRALSLRPEERYPSMTALLVELGRDHGRVLRFALTAGAIGLGSAAIVTVLHFATAGTAGGGVTLTQACNDLGAPMSKVWSPESEKSVRDRLGALTKAEDAALEAQNPKLGHLDLVSSQVDFIVKPLDEYAAAWKKARGEACEATHVRHEQSQELLDARMICLDHRLRAMTALTTVIASDETTSTLDALVAVRNLPPIADCADVATLAKDAQAKRIYESATDRRVADKNADKIAKETDGVTSDLAKLRALTDTGQLAAAKPLAEGILSRARSLGDDGLLAEVARGVASYDTRAGDEAAEDRLVEALRAAKAAGRDDLALLSTIDLVRTVGVDGGRTADAETWIGLAEADLKRRPSDQRARALLWRSKGEVRVIEGRYGDARSAFEASLAAAEEAGPHDGPDSVRALADLGNLLVEIGSFHEAETTSRRALDMATRTTGDSSVEAALARVPLGRALGHQGHADGGVDMISQALGVTARAFGADSRQMADVLVPLAEVEILAKNEAAAVDHIERAYKIRTSTWRPLLVATAADDYAVTLLEAGRGVDAIDAAQQAVELIEGRLGTDRVELRLPLVHLGEALASAKKAKEAFAAFKRCVEITDHAGAWDDDGRVSGQLDAYARALEARGDTKDAVDAAARGLAFASGALQRGDTVPRHPRVTTAIADAKRIFAKAGDQARQREAFGLVLGSLKLLKERDQELEAELAALGATDR